MGGERKRGGGRNRYIERIRERGGGRNRYIDGENQRGRLGGWTCDVQILWRTYFCRCLGSVPGEPRPVGFNIILFLFCTGTLCGARTIRAAGLSGSWPCNPWRTSEALVAGLDSSPHPPTGVLVPPRTPPMTVCLAAFISCREYRSLARQ